MFTAGVLEQRRVRASLQKSISGQVAYEHDDELLRNRGLPDSRMEWMREEETLGTGNATRCSMSFRKMKDSTGLPVDFGP